MNVGDYLEIKIQELVVGHAQVTEISDGKAYVQIPSLEVIFGVRNVLTDLEPEAPEVDRQLAGTVQQEVAESATPETPEPPKYVPPAAIAVTPPEQAAAAAVAKPPVRANDDIGDGLENAVLDSSILDD